MDKVKEQQLMKKFENYAAGFYFDCTRDNLSEKMRNICASTTESRDYNKFASAVSTVLFKKVYVEGEMWKPQLILGLIDIVLEILDVQEVKTGFNPANAMLGETKDSSTDIRSQIVEQFNKQVKEFGEPEMLTI